jgi:hypothetical protein
MVVFTTTEVLVTLIAASPVARMVLFGEPDTRDERRWTVPVARLIRCGTEVLGSKVTRSPDRWKTRGPAMSRSRTGMPSWVAP